MADRHGEIDPAEVAKLSAAEAFLQAAEMCHREADALWTKYRMPDAHLAQPELRGMAVKLRNRAEALLLDR